MISYLLLSEGSSNICSCYLLQPVYVINQS